MAAYTRGDDRPGGSRLLAEVVGAEKAERARIARALHDGGLQLALAALQELDGLATGDPAAPAALRRDLEELVVTLRSLTQSGDDEGLSRLTLGVAVERLGVIAARRGRLAVVTRVDSRVEGVHDVLVRDAVRELLANAVRHARASRVEVAVGPEDDAIVIAVSDDGVGLSEAALAEAQRTGHMGVRGLERVARELGGRLVHGPGIEGRGVRVALTLPRVALVAQQSLEQQLQEERRWSAALVSALRDALLVIRDGAIVQVNDAFCALTGLERGALLGTGVADCTFWAGDEAFGLWLSRVQEAGGGDARVALRRPGGSLFDAVASVARIDDGRGGEIGVLLLLKPLQGFL